TSGLDSFSSLQLVQNLKRIAKEKQAIVCLTVHQPGSELFALFDRVYCMRYGQILFHGLNKNMEAVIAATYSSAPPLVGPTRAANSNPRCNQRDRT
ncbi:unnamed protein product, partial [Amoebophrya sp. A25]